MGDTAEDSFIRPSWQLWLQLGEVRQIATVLVNSHAMETVWRRPSTVRTDDAVRAGNDTLEMKLRILWPNRLIGDLQPSALAQFTHTNILDVTQNSPLLTSGILAPVVVQPEYVLRWR